MSVELSISQIAARTGLSPKTIRYYEDLGLVTPLRAKNGYRIYSEQDEQSLLLVKRAKLLGFTLKEISMVLPNVSGGLCETAKAQTVDFMKSKVEYIDKQIKELTTFKNYLNDELNKIETTRIRNSENDGCSCLGENIS